MKNQGTEVGRFRVYIETDNYVARAFENEETADSIINFIKTFGKPFSYIVRVADSKDNLVLIKEGTWENTDEVEKGGN